MDSLLLKKLRSAAILSDCSHSATCKKNQKTKKELIEEQKFLKKQEQRKNLGLPPLRKKREIAFYKGNQFEGTYINQTKITPYEQIAILQKYESFLANGHYRKADKMEAELKLPSYYLNRAISMTLETSSNQEQREIQNAFRYRSNPRLYSKNKNPAKQQAVKHPKKKLNSLTSKNMRYKKLSKQIDYLRYKRHMLQGSTYEARTETPNPNSLSQRQKFHKKQKLRISLGLPLLKNLSNPTLIHRDLETVLSKELNPHFQEPSPQHHNNS